MIRYLLQALVNPVAWLAVGLAVVVSYPAGYLKGDTNGFERSERQQAMATVELNQSNRALQDRLQAVEAAAATARNKDIADASNTLKTGKCVIVGQDPSANDVPARLNRIQIK